MRTESAPEYCRILVNIPGLPVMWFEAPVSEVHLVSMMVLSKVSAARACARLSHKLLKVRICSPIVLSSSFLSFYDGDLVALWCIIVWIIWGYRNAILHGQRGNVVTVLVADAKKYISEFKEAQPHVHVTALRELTVGLSSWAPPMEGVFKLHVDGSWISSLRDGGISGVIHNQLGVVIGGFAKKLFGCYSVDSTEALALLQGIIFAKDIGFQVLVIENDYLPLMATIANSSLDLSPLGNVLEEIKQELRGLQWFSCSYVRTANRVVHEHAVFVQDIADEVFWIEELPESFDSKKRKIDVFDTIVESLSIGEIEMPLACNEERENLSVKHISSFGSQSGCCSESSRITKEK
ncbi:hypothetical protein F0562_030388 [Nyssa sinensis]|uniref:RNase H type-1 domain-containing protein n=1 Tax=Nyssa sinensis TaxID=561372 RepID=A0A5J5AW93_9ASTE|nr:hypothetical protein F0562_030388 [Nyssa sinensis]